MKPKEPDWDEPFHVPLVPPRPPIFKRVKWDLPSIWKRLVDGAGYMNVMRHPTPATPTRYPEEPVFRPKRTAHRSWKARVKRGGVR